MANKSKTKGNLIKVKTIARHHVAQLHIEHFWDGEFDWDGKTILGRLPDDGSILVQETATGALRRISPIAFLDWQLEVLGCRKKVNGKWEYAPTPHTNYSRKAKEYYDQIPQLFSEGGAK